MERVVVLRYSFLYSFNKLKINWAVVLIIKIAAVFVLSQVFAEWLINV